MFEPLTRGSRLAGERPLAPWRVARANLGALLEDRLEDPSGRSHALDIELGARGRIR